MPKFLMWVNTHNRCEMLECLIEDSLKISSNHTVDFFVINDASTQDYNPLIEKRVIKYYYKTKLHHGKVHYWKLVNFAVQKIKSLTSKYDYFIKTDDDMRLVGGFFDLAADLVDNLPDPYWATIDILSAPKQRGKTLPGNPAPVWNLKYKYFRTKWVDMNFIFRPGVFPGKIGPVRAGKASSGVGLWLTRYFNKQEYNMYQSPFSLVLHGKHPSQMNSEERNKNPIITTEKK